VTSAKFALGLLLALGLKAQIIVDGLPDNVPSCATYTVTRTNAAFKAAAATADVTLFTLLARRKINAVTVKHSAQFSDGAGAMTDVSVSVGDSSSTTAYTLALSIGEVTAVSDTAFQDTVLFKSTTMAARAVLARFTATARNFGAVSVAITAATNANPVELTAAAHGLATGAHVTISGATGNWTAINGSWTVTVTGGGTFTIPVDSTSFGALAGAPVYDATFLTGGSVGISICTVRLP
jgi:hypothetical protein